MKLFVFPGGFIKKNPDSHFFFTIMLATMVFSFISSFGLERTLLSIDFNQQIPPVNTLAGTWKKNKDGLFLEKDSRIAIHLHDTIPVNNGEVRVSFYPPADRKSSLPLEPGAEDCFCALKISAGRCVAEISDKGLSLVRMDTSFSFVDSILGSINRSPDPFVGEMTLSLRIIDRVVTASLNDSILVSAKAPDYSFGSIEIATYQMPFVLTAFSTVSFSRDTLTIDKKNKCLSLAGRYHPSHFNAGNGQHNHSFITWTGGFAGDNALFTVSAPDSAVYESLLAIGGVPGNNLTMYPWSSIKDARQPGPDLKTKGSPITIEIYYGGNLLSASSLLHDENGRPFDFRFAGNRKLIPAARTGCVVCLESCPNGAIGNAAYSMRDLVRNIARFNELPDQPFKEEDEVTIRISLTQK